MRAKEGEERLSETAWARFRSPEQMNDFLDEGGGTGNRVFFGPFKGQVKEEASTALTVELSTD